MSSCGVPSALTASLLEGESVTTRVLPETDWDEASVMLTPPEVWPDSLTCIFESSAGVEIGSLKVMLRMPVRVWYVAESKTGRIVSLMVMGWSAAASIGLPEVSETAPASMSSWGDVMELTVFFCTGGSVTVRVLPEADKKVTPVRVAPPEVWPDSLTCSFESSIVVEIGSLKATRRSPDMVLYAAELKLGGVPSVTAMGWSAAASIGLSDVSETAPASMSSWGVVMALTVSLCEGESHTTRVLFETDWEETSVMLTPPEVWPDSLTCSFESSIVVEIGSLKVMLRMPVRVWYVAESKTGGIVYLTVMGWSAVAAILLL